MIHVMVPDGVKFFKAAGYKIHHKGIVAGGFILDTISGERWHAKPITQYYGRDTKNTKYAIHYDITVDGMHRVSTVVWRDKQERRRLAKIKKSLWPKNPVFNPQEAERLFYGMPKNRKKEIAPDVAVLQKQFINLERKWYNPLRYIKGKFYVKNITSR